VTFCACDRILLVLHGFLYTGKSSFKFSNGRWMEISN
jgi:hypothetical protein